MPKRKKYPFLLLATVLCLSLMACGKSSTKSNDSKITGSDWRTTGIVRDSGKIIRDGETTKVLVCIHKNDACFYYDKEIQTLFDSVTYPMAIQDPWEAYQSTDFSDRNDDGNSDICMTFRLSDGSEVIMTWLWDADKNGYVFNADGSSVSEDIEK